ncbi:MAG: alpha/beta fold hydrolase [Anaerolineaceae bacterium]|nr:alpha/beta fold hydrolase [Anaerolineaceae bacterium]MCB9100752.1 alpha/beta fold hydrolase [Anaerolineales bacterium]
MKKSILIITLFLLALTAGTTLAQAPKGKEYIVQADDWLSTIAEKEYGDPLAYPAIMAATNAKAAEDESFTVIDDPSLIEAGQKLWIPAEATLMAEGVSSTPFVPGPPEIIACPDFITASPVYAAEVEGQTYECGLVEVPENYAAPDGRTLELLYIRLFSPAESPAADPLLYLSGGPGGSAVREASNPVLYANMQLVRQSRDVVFYDQRGTGLSAPLNCGAVQAGIGAAIELLPDKAEDIQAGEKGPKAQLFNVALCAQIYTAIGVDLAQYNSIASTKDMASLMTALGYEQYNLYGTSYGTKLAQVALRETPDRIRSAVMDGTSPVSQPQVANSAIEKNEQYVRIFAQCAADAACNAAYPNLPDRFTALLNQLQDNPIALDKPIIPGEAMTLIAWSSDPIDQIDIPFLRNLIVYNGVASYHEHKELSIVDKTPRLILALEEGDTETVRAIFDGIGPLPAGVKAEVAQQVPDESAIIPDNDYIAPTIETLLAEAQQVPAVASPSSPEQQWVALTVNDLATRLQSGEEQTEVIRDMMELAALPAKGRDPQLLIDYANEYLPEEMAAQANALAEAMTPADVRATMWHLDEVADAMRFKPELQPGYHEEVTYAVNCAEDVTLRPASVVDEAIAAATYPQFAEFDGEAYKFFETACSYFPKTVVPPSFIEPVVSDIPVLLIQGDLDTNTPPSQARDVESHLTNATYVPFNTEGHVVAAGTATCPGTIAAQFLNDSTADLDTSCTDEFVITFELP